MGDPVTRHRRWKAENGVYVLGPQHHSLSCHLGEEQGKWWKFNMLSLLLRKPELSKEAIYLMEFLNWIIFVFFSLSGVGAQKENQKL